MAQASPKSFPFHGGLRFAHPPYELRACQHPIRHSSASWNPRTKPFTNCRVCKPRLRTLPLNVGTNNEIGAQTKAVCTPYGSWKAYVGRMSRRRYPPNGPSIAPNHSRSWRITLRSSALRLHLPWPPHPSTKTVDNFVNICDLKL